MYAHDDGRCVQVCSSRKSACEARRKCHGQMRPGTLPWTTNMHGLTLVKYFRDSKSITCRTPPDGLVVWPLLPNSCHWIARPPISSKAWKWRSSAGRLGPVGAARLIMINCATERSFFLFFLFFLNICLKANVQDRYFTTFCTKGKGCSSAGRLGAAGAAGLIYDDLRSAKMRLRAAMGIRRSHSRTCAGKRPEPTAWNGSTSTKEHRQSEDEWFTAAQCTEAGRHMEAGRRLTSSTSMNAMKRCSWPCRRRQASYMSIWA